MQQQQQHHPLLCDLERLVLNVKNNIQCATTQTADAFDYDAFHFHCRVPTVEWGGGFPNWLKMFPSAPRTFASTGPLRTAWTRFDAVFVRTGTINNYIIIIIIGVVVRQHCAVIML